jgi:hypothetical protein
MATPDRADWAPRSWLDNAIVKALARAFRWRKMLDTGVHSTLDDLARVKGFAPSYLSGIPSSRSWRRTSCRRSSMGGSRRSRSWRTCSLDFRWTGRGSDANSARARADERRPSARRSDVLIFARFRKNLGRREVLMAETSRHDAWQAGESYDAYMGRWSRRIAPLFLDRLDAA